MTSKPCSINGRTHFAILVLLASALLGACAPVQPWQRGRLAQPMMALDEDAMLTAISRHVYDSKEAAFGGIGPAGGGCGCN
jgi:hypothetical protein